MQALALLRTLCSNVEVRHYIRRIEARTSHAPILISNQSRILGMLLSTFTDSFRIKHFAWEIGSLYAETVFPSLITLECRRLSCNMDLSWIKWHLAHCRIRRLCLSLSFRISGDTGKWLWNGIAMPSVEDLCLEYMDISELDPSKLGDLKGLELNLCSGTLLFLERWMAVDRANQLSSLKIAANLPPAFLRVLIDFISQRTSLRQLALRMGGTREVLSIESLIPHAATLEYLVLDFRHVITEVHTTIKYTLRDFEGIMRHFSSLKGVGIPLDFRDFQSVRYRRAKYQSIPKIFSPH
ncbi:hypothetical protein HIM_11347 [Hirsutella minnesotensis 3608]|uniref:F-box domain-containing protein n=1 Tax=Hirsutella minnesotensis 3608 TaxID=1043627 RepID=A0A0F7ZRA3_9HYPO|nr:hypothetical protein HIM_11347 [Hirsutella minnesotensis 3608]